MFRCYSYTIIRERINLCLLKLQLLKQSIKIHRCVVNMVVVWLHILGPYWCRYILLFYSGIWKIGKLGKVFIINIINLATCFGKLNHHQANSNNNVKAHSAIAHTLGSHTVYTSRSVSARQMWFCVVVGIGLVMVQYTETFRQDYNTDNIMCCVIDWKIILWPNIVQSSCSGDLWYDVLYLLTVIRLTHGGSNTVHIYIKTVHRMTKLTHRRTRLVIEQHN